VFVGAFIHYYFLKLVKMIMMGMGSMVERIDIEIGLELETLQLGIYCYKVKSLIIRRKWTFHEEILHVCL
jgi:hypothetical protein